MVNPAKHAVAIAMSMTSGTGRVRSRPEYQADHDHGAEHDHRANHDHRADSVSGAVGCWITMT
ncbi:MAG TPA: hypothetical protein VMU94_27015 [Streptosporangiaceae bacterium]|nr:hypothetical protein [Streptosporangiaceae bacterium]